MKFSVASVFAVLAATVSATPAFTNSAFDVVPGSTFTLTWGNATGPVTIVLATGTSDDLTKVETIDCMSAERLLTALFFLSLFVAMSSC